LIDIFKRAYILEAARTTERQFVDSWSRENLFMFYRYWFFPKETFLLKKKWRLLRIFLEHKGSAADEKLARKRIYRPMNASLAMVIHRQEIWLCNANSFELSTEAPWI